MTGNSKLGHHLSLRSEVTRKIARAMRNTLFNIYYHGNKTCYEENIK
jgi:hypothetical protein